MRGFGIDRILAGTAVALVLAATDGRAIAAPEPAAAVESGRCKRRRRNVDEDLRRPGNSAGREE